MRLSSCGRFQVFDVLFIDREVGDALSAWAGTRGLRAEDAVQVALAAFVVDAGLWQDAADAYAAHRGLCSMDERSRAEAEDL